MHGHCDAWMKDLRCKFADRWPSYGIDELGGQCGVGNAALCQEARLLQESLVHVEDLCQVWHIVRCTEQQSILSVLCEAGGREDKPIPLNGTINCGAEVWQAKSCSAAMQLNKQGARLYYPNGV